ncbi:MAG: hypothetical protein KGD58_16165 [Candidatus Lokiarchaeota archaeon]|nr:hypothetical protein [Candidatus Lokiarchaeota archaeon]
MQKPKTVSGFFNLLIKCLLVAAFSNSSSLKVNSSSLDPGRSKNLIFLKIQVSSYFGISPVSSESFSSSFSTIT